MNPPRCNTRQSRRPPARSCPLAQAAVKGTEEERGVVCLETQKQEVRAECKLRHAGECKCWERDKERAREIDNRTNGWPDPAGQYTAGPPHWNCVGDVEPAKEKIR